MAEGDRQHGLVAPRHSRMDTVGLGVKSPRPSGLHRLVTALHGAPPSQEDSDTLGHAHRSTTRPGRRGLNRRLLSSSDSRPAKLFELMLWARPAVSLLGSPCGGRSVSPRFTDGEMEASGGAVTWPGSHDLEVTELGLNPGSRAPGPVPNH